MNKVSRIIVAGMLAFSIAGCQNNITEPKAEGVFSGLENVGGKSEFAS